RTENSARLSQAAIGPSVPDNVFPGAKVYILLIPGASQETLCSTDGRPAGALSHNHVFTKAPGDPGYNAHFQLVLVGPGPSYRGATFAGAYNSPPPSWPASPADSSSFSSRTRPTPSGRSRCDASHRRREACPELRSLRPVVQLTGITGSDRLRAAIPG